MILDIQDWRFDIDPDRTMEHSSLLSSDHCACGYCRNYYAAVPDAFPGIIPFLARFGVNLHAPVELMPIEPTLYLAGYRVYGQVLKKGRRPVQAEDVTIRVTWEASDKFRLEFGPVMLPWVLDEDPDEVVSPANEPDFLDQMYKKLLMLSLPEDTLYS